MSVKPDQLKRCKQDSAKSVQFDFQEIDVTGMSLMSLIQMGGAMLLKHAIAGEISDHLKRPYYEHGENFAGHRNGYQTTTIDTPNGPVVYDRPKVANAKGFKSKFHTPNMHRPDELRINRRHVRQWCLDSESEGFASGGQWREGQAFEINRFSCH